MWFFAQVVGDSFNTTILQFGFPMNKTPEMSREALESMIRNGQALMQNFLQQFGNAQAAAAAFGAKTGASNGSAATPPNAVCPNF